MTHGESFVDFTLMAKNKVFMNKGVIVVKPSGDVRAADVRYLANNLKLHIKYLREAGKEILCLDNNVAVTDISKDGLDLSADEIAEIKFDKLAVVNSKVPSVRENLDEFFKQAGKEYKMFDDEKPAMEWLLAKN